MIIHSCELNSLSTAAFGELLVSQLMPILQLQFVYDVDPSLITSTITGGGTISCVSNMLQLQTADASNSSATLTSNKRLSYRPGQGVICIFTATYSTGVAGSTQITGIGNSTDGYFFGYNGTSFGILHRCPYNSPATDNWIAQSSWNIDPMNGTGPSGMTLDPTKGSVYKIQYQWLGFGAINFFIENPTTGQLVQVHQIKYANVHTKPALSNPSLQLMSQVSNTTNATRLTLRNGAIGAFVEGLLAGYNERNSILSNVYATSTVFRSFLTIQNKSSYAAVANQVMIYPDFLTIWTTSAGANDCLYVLYLNPSFTSPLTYIDINTNGSVVQYSNTVSTFSSTGRTIFCFYLENGESVSINLADYQIYLNPGDILSIAGTSPSGSVNVRAAISWQEFF